MKAEVEASKEEQDDGEDEGGQRDEQEEVQVRDVRYNLELLS